MPVGVAEASLGERVRRGDPDAFEALYQDYSPGIYDFLVRLVRDRAAAEDLTQTTFIKAFERRATLRDPQKVRSWLWATAHNQAVNHLARQRRSDPFDQQFDLATLARGPEETAEAKDAAELVWLAAASLEPRQYTVLDLTVRRDLSTQEVAETLGVPVGHAAVLVNRAREALGHAVRYLLVARRREQCPQLAALVPAGIRALTPDQRSAVDHHMRRCERCRELGDRLTAPAELLGTFVLLPMPAHLQKVDWTHLLGATRPGKGAPANHHTAQPGKARRIPQHAAHSAAHQAISVIVTVAVAAALTVPQSGSAVPASPAMLTAANGLSACNGIAVPAGIAPVVKVDHCGKVGDTLSGDWYGDIADITMDRLTAANQVNGQPELCSRGSVVWHATRLSGIGPAYFSLVLPGAASGGQRAQPVGGTSVLFNSFPSAVHFTVCFADVGHVGPVLILLMHSDSGLYDAWSDEL